MITALSDILRYFPFGLNSSDIQLCTIGHINDTYIVRAGLNGRSQRFVLQRINLHVFRQPQALMDNIIKVTTFLREKIEQVGGNPDRETLTLIPTQEGNLYQITPQGEYWRAYRYIEGTRTYTQVENPAVLYQAGRAFGRFMQLLNEFPTHELNETIPDFHHTPKRFQTLMRVVDADTYNRAYEVRDLIAQAEARVSKMGWVVDALSNGKLPRRVTHNDTKFNNVLIDEATNEAVCVVDLDTVMPGSALYDFGDFVRTGANTSAEDERNLDKVGLDLEYFNEIARGFLEETRESLTPLEREWLPYSAWLLTFEVAMRFLTDYLEGDVYFRIHHAKHNLERARAQFKLASDIERKEAALARIIARYS